MVVVPSPSFGDGGKKGAFTVWYVQGLRSKDQCRLLLFLVRKICTYFLYKLPGFPLVIRPPPGTIAPIRMHVLLAGALVFR